MDPINGRPASRIGRGWAHLAIRRGADDANLARNRFGRDLVVASDHDYAHTGAAAISNGLGHRFLRRVYQRDQAQEGKIGVGHVFLPWLARNSEQQYRNNNAMHLFPAVLVVHLRGKLDRIQFFPGKPKHTLALSCEYNMICTMCVFK
jgi:hypothetical protein